MMLDEWIAVACTVVLDDDVLEMLVSRGIQLLSVSYKGARGLG